MSAQDLINGPLYDRPDLVHNYNHASLFPAEAVALVRYRDDVAGRRVLDLGCGAGRLTTFLLPLTRRYVGIDVSPHMVAHCRKRFPGVTFHRGDMRDLSGFDDACFDTVFATYNLLDAVSHEDRLLVLGRIHRVLEPGGMFLFSSHNRGCAKLPEVPHMAWSRNPITQLRSTAEYVMAQANHVRIKRLQRFESDYALLNDSGHNFAVLHYYIDRDAQARQLAAAGFELLECLGEDGASLAPGGVPMTCGSIHYVARRRSL